MKKSVPIRNPLSQSKTKEISNKIVIRKLEKNIQSRKLFNIFSANQFINNFLKGVTRTAKNTN